MISTGPRIRLANTYGSCCGTAPTVSNPRFAEYHRAVCATSPTRNVGTADRISTPAYGGAEGCATGIPPLMKLQSAVVSNVPAHNDVVADCRVASASERC